MSVVTADRTAAVTFDQARPDTRLLGVRCALLGAVVVGATAYAAPRVAVVRHGEDVAVLGVLLAIALAARSWRGSATEPRAIPMRAADLSIAGGLAGAAAFLVWQLPVVFGPDADAWGASLGVVAPLMGAAIAVLLGSRMLYRLRGAVTALALLSPALLRPAYVVLDAATKYAARGLVELASTVDSSVLAPGGSASAAGDLLAQRLTRAGALEAAAVMVLLCFRTTNGRRTAKAAWSALVVVVCFGAALRNAVPAGCLATALAIPAFGLRFPSRALQPEPLRCLPRRESTLLAVTAVALAGIGVLAAGLVPSSHHSSTMASSAFPDAMAKLPGAAAGAADPREVALAGAGAQWLHWTLPATSNNLSSSASLSVDYVASTNGFDATTLSAALRAGGYHLESTQPAAVGPARATLRSFAGSNGDGLTLLTWTPDSAPGHLAVVTVYEPDGVRPADAAAAQSVAARVASSKAAP